MDAKTLRQRRIRVGLAQERLARMINISCYTLSSIEGERRPLTTTNARRLDVVLTAYERAITEANEQLQLIS